MIRNNLWNTFKPQTRRRIKFGLLVALIAAYPAYGLLQRHLAHARAVAQHEADQAEFNRLCKEVAGYKIHKVVEDVEGIQLLKVRHGVKDGDMLAPDAAFAAESEDDGYISHFLVYRSPSMAMDGSYFVNPNYHVGDQPGFRYVDVLDEHDGKRYRYTGSQKIVGQADLSAPEVKKLIAKDPNADLNIYRWGLDRILASDPAPRYAVTFENPVIPEERAKGFASSTVKVIDTQTNEVLAEMTQYVWGPRQPSSYNPNPWLVAYKCPGFLHGGSAGTRQFVDRVLVSKGAKRPPTPDLPSTK